MKLFKKVNKVFRRAALETYFCSFVSLKKNTRTRTYELLLSKSRFSLLSFLYALSSTHPFGSNLIIFNNKADVDAHQIQTLLSSFRNFSSLNFISLNFTYNKFNDFLFFLINSNLAFNALFPRKIFFLDTNNFHRFFAFKPLLKLKNFHGYENFCTKNRQYFSKFTVLLKPKLMLFFPKYFFFSKKFNLIFSRKFKNNLVNFLLNSKKRVGRHTYQSVQDSAGYTNDSFLFLNKFFFKLRKNGVSKLAAYSTSYEFLPRINYKKYPATSLFKVPAASASQFFKKTPLSVSAFPHILNFFYKPLFFKYFYIFFRNSIKSLLSPKFLFTLFPRHFSFFRDKSAMSNIFPSENFSFFIKKYFLYITNFNKYNYRLMFTLQVSILKFIQFCTGKKAMFKVYPYLYNVLNTEEQIRCSLWSQKVKYYRKVLGPKLFLNESLQIMYLSFKYKDIHLFSNWTTAMFYKISFWKYKMFLRYLKYVLRYFFLGIYRKLEFKGIKFQLKGKISVAGNSRTRTSYHYVGFTSHSTFNNKILHKLSLVRTFTGVLGFKIWFVF